MDMAHEFSDTAVLPPAITAETLAMVREILARSDEPLGLKAVLHQFPAAVRPTLEPLTEAVGEAVRAGTLFGFAKVRGQATFWDRSQAEFVAMRMKRLLLGTPRMESELLRMAKSKALDDFPKAGVRRVLYELLSTEVIKKLPPYIGGRANPLSLQPPRSLDYVRRALEKVGAKLGVSYAELLKDAAEMARDYAEELSTPTAVTAAECSEVTPSIDPPSIGDDQHFTGEVAAAAAPATGMATATAVRSALDPSIDLDTRLIQGALEINPRVAHGDMVLVAELRGRFDFQADKDEFDKALLRLAGQRRIALHRFDRPWLISETERDQLVRDDEGHFYNTLSFPDPT